MMATDPKPVSPSAIMEVIRMNARRRPLWKLGTVADFMDLDTAQVMARIEDGTFPYAFNLGNSGRCAAPRILAVSVLEKKLGRLPDIGATKDLDLPAVIDLVLPARDVRSTELQRLFSLSQQIIHKHGRNFKVTRKPKATDGPNSYTVFNRASVAAWLAKRRII